MSALINYADINKALAENALFIHTYQVRVKIVQI